MRATPLTTGAYARYGDVIAARDDVKPVGANLGTAERYNGLATLENKRIATAKANLCVFRCQPMVKGPARKFTVRLLERHAHSTQAFVPMQGIERYLVIVCLGGDRPDLATLGAFLATGGQGITYRPGVWHHPLVAMDRPGDFACLVWEDGSAGDCDTVNLPSEVVIDF
jgi:ureidoglycolate lyase